MQICCAFNICVLVELQYIHIVHCWFVNLLVARVCSNCCSVYEFHVLFDVCKCDVFVCFDVYGVFAVVDCGLLSRGYMLCERVEWVGGML